LAAWVGVAGCGVDRDLDPGRFACGYGGPCEGAGADAGPGLDAGAVDLSACAGPYSGTSLGAGAVLGSVDGLLRATGELSLEFTTTAHPLGLTVLARVRADDTIVLDGAASVTLSGLFNQGGCSASGTWTSNGATGQWSVEKDP